MSKRDLKKSDLENEKLALEKKEKEVSLAEQLNNLATNAALKAVDWQTKFDNLERSHKSLVQKVDEQAITIKSQSAIIKKQEETIRIQSAQIGLMVEKARQQDEIIATLTLELEKYKPKEC